MSDLADAHWLTTAIASYLHEPSVKAEEFQVWRLAVDVATRHAVLTMSDGNSERAKITQTMDYTDFPLDGITLWLVADGEHWVLMLPNEY